MNHDDRAALIRPGVEGAGRHWLSLGCQDRGFVVALADVLGPGATIFVTDCYDHLRRAQLGAIHRRFPGTTTETRAFILGDGIPYGPFDGVLATNTLHFVDNRDATLREIRFSLSPGGRLLIVENDTDRGNPFTPHPFSFETWRREAMTAGYEEPRLIGRMPSLFFGEIYAAVAEVGPTLLHSRPHGEDREE